MSREGATKIVTVGVVMLLGLAAAQPLLVTGGRLPWAADTLIHLYRLVQLDHLLRHGYLFSRWAPDLAYGFGFPLFNYYAPLSYYVAEFFHLAGMDFAPALLGAFTLLILSAGMSLYAWATEVWGQRAGLVAAAAYVTAPYLLYNVYHRGALAEVLAMALMPALLWSVTRLARTGSRASFILTALLYAALPLSHNLTALIFTPVIMMYVALLLTQYAARNTGHVLRAVLALLLGLGLSAFFWVPMLLERNAVQIYQLFAPEAFDYRLHFVSVSELLSPPQGVDPNLVLPPTPHSIGLIPLVLAIMALALGWQRWENLHKIVAVFAAFLAVGSLFLTLSQSRAIWDALSILRFVQFPWRFLGPASIALAFLAGGAWSEPQRHPDTKSAKKNHGQLGVSVSRWLASLTIAGLVVYGFTWEYVPFLPPIIQPTVSDIHRYEREAGALGTTSAGDYLPATVKKLPDDQALVERYARSNVIERLDRASLPADAKIMAARYRLLSAEVTIETPVPFTAVFDVFYFAGWQARVDGTPIIITPTDPHGLVSFPVPAGLHRVEVFFGSTPLRTTAGLMSLLSVLVLIAANKRPAVHRRADDIKPGQPGCADTESASADWIPSAQSLRSRYDTQALALTGIMVILIIAKSAYLDSHETVFRRTHFDGTRVADVSHPLNVNFDTQMMLMGCEPESPRVEMDGVVRVALYWRAMQKLDADYSISAQLVDERGFVYGQRDSQHPGGYPTSRWKLTDYARDSHDIALLPGTPPGQYRLRVGVYRVNTPGGLSVLDQNGAPAGTVVDAATVQVTRPGWRLFTSQPEMPKPQHTTNASLAPGLVLIGYDWPLDEVDAGALLPFTLYWQAAWAQQRDLEGRLELVDKDKLTLGHVHPISPQFPTSRLMPGDVLRGPNAARIPASTPGATYTVRLTLVDETGQAHGDAVNLGRVTVRVPERTMTEPPIPHRLQISLGDQVRLIGYEMKAQTSNIRPQNVQIVVYWQAQRELTHDYKSFVHLLDAVGRLVAGSDQIPAQWTRPTTGWIAGEYVADAHTLALPQRLAPGEYRLEVGMYDAESNIRLDQSVMLDQPILISP